MVSGTERPRFKALCVGSGKSCLTPELQFLHLYSGNENTCAVCLLGFQRLDPMVYVKFNGVLLYSFYYLLP